MGSKISVGAEVGQDGDASESKVRQTMDLLYREM